jgi:ribosome maturation factor RimP
MTTGTEKLHEIVATPLADLGIEVSDIELAGGLLRVTVERSDGTSIDIDAITAATRILSRELDIHDPIPSRYTLEVSSPGLERPLRTPAHFLRAVGQKVAVRTNPGVEGDRRVTGLLTTADDTGIVVTSESNDGPVARRLAYAEIERARTVFEWGAPPKAPKGTAPKAPKGTARRESTAAKEAAR